MKPRSLFPTTLALFALAGSALAQSPAQKRIPSRPGDDARFHATVAAQKAINRHFHGSLLPKVKPCWSRLRGKGTLEVKSVYADDGRGRWSFQRIVASKSDLAPDQERAAVACVGRAATGSSFPREKTDKGKSYLISWAWPVPMPPDADRQAARMWGSSGGEGGGCDGRGASARCLTCKGSPLTCVYVCVGSDTCEVQATKPGGFDSICTEGGQCASGGLFGLAGVMVMY